MQWLSWVLMHTLVSLMTMWVISGKSQKTFHSLGVSVCACLAACPYVTRKVTFTSTRTQIWWDSQWTKAERCILTDRLNRLSAQDSLVSIHHYFMWSSCFVVTPRMHVQNATFFPRTSLLQVRYVEYLDAKTRRQPFKDGDVLPHDVLGIELCRSRSVLLKCPHKICKHPLNPYFCKEVALGNVLGKTLWDTV